MLARLSRNAGASVPGPWLDSRPRSAAWAKTAEADAAASRGEAADVADEMWAVALPRRSATQRLHEAAERQGLTLGHQYVVDDYHAMLGLVAANLAVACVPGISLTPPDPRIVLRPFAEPMLRQVAAVSDPVSVTRAPHQRLLLALAAAAEEQERWLARVTAPATQIRN